MHSIRPYFLFALILLVNVGALRAQAPPSYAQLKKLDACELDRLFEQASPGAMPVGPARGQVLLLTESRRPRLTAGLASSVWKGKHFDDDAGYINQFLGFRALRGKAELGESWHDGKPAIILAYPRGTPLFGNIRDEVREIGPGLYLGRVYDRCPCPRFRGYFAFEVCCPPAIRIEPPSP